MAYKIDYNKLYSDRLKIIDHDMYTAYKKGNWDLYKKLKAEKKDIKEKLNNLQN